jgi:YD repeat-containing protein
VRRQRYDDAGNLVEEAFFDGNHSGVVPKDKTFASVRHRFDARQRLVESSFFDAAGAPGKGPDGVATVRYQRDAYGHATEMAYFDGSGAPVASTAGKLVVRSRYDDAGRLTEERFLDPAGATRIAADGCAGHRTKYDSHGRVAEESCLDTGDGVTLGSEGWATRRTLRDARGNAVYVTTYGPDGALHNSKDGFARHTLHYDERNLVDETAFFDALGKPFQDARSSKGYGYEFSVDPVTSRFAPGLAARASMDERGRLPPETIQAIVRQALPTLDDCYTAGLSRDQKLEGVVRAKFVIAPGGAVSQTGEDHSRFPDKAVVACVLDVVGKLTFPKRSAPGTVTVLYPVQFTPPPPSVRGRRP